MRLEKLWECLLVDALGTPNTLHPAPCTLHPTPNVRREKLWKCHAVDGLAHIKQSRPDSEDSEDRTHTHKTVTARRTRAHKTVKARHKTVKAGLAHIRQSRPDGLGTHKPVKARFWP